MRAPILKRFVLITFILTITAVCLFGSAGRLDWSNAMGSSGTLPHHRSGVHRRYGAIRSWLPSGEMSKPVRAGIRCWSASRFCSGQWLCGLLPDWTTGFIWSNGMSSLALPAGVAAAVLAAALIAWAMRSNRFFSSVVRIQKDRGHTVVDGGPYRFIRHPGYAGMSVFTLADTVNPRFLLGARTGCGYCVGNRSTDGHGRLTLHNELDGYADYARRVRYRLMPGIW